MPGQDTFDLKTLKVKEARQIREITGLKLGQVFKAFQDGEVDDELLGAIALVALRRSNPQATQADADEVAIFPLLGVNGDSPAE